MSIFDESIGLYTDDYQLAMAQAHLLQGRADREVTFNYYFRTLPFKGGYAIAAGIRDFAQMVENLHFSDGDIDYLVHTSGGKYQTSFLRALRNFKFTGDIHAVPDGEIVFPHEPLVVFRGTMFQAKMIDTQLMNIVNRTSITATKTARIVQAAKGKPVIDMSLRRAGFGNINISRGALIGGAAATSNRYVGRLFYINASGSMAHDYVQSFPTDFEAFVKWGDIYKEDSVFLVDTRDTLRIGIPAVIQAAIVMKDRYGIGPKAIRLDSGDLAYLSKEARRMMDEAGFPNIQVWASNRLDEYTITSLQLQGACIDAYGVGESIALCGGETIDGVFKLSEFDGTATMKFSDNVEKQTIPGAKVVARYYLEGIMRADGMHLQHEVIPEVIHDPHYPERTKEVGHFRSRNLLHPMFIGGKRCYMPKYEKPPLHELPAEITRFDNPHKYPVGVSKNILELRSQLISNLQKG